MKKMLEIEIERCGDCHNFNLAEKKCNITGATTRGSMPIPSWCPLPDAEPIAAAGTAATALAEAGYDAVEVFRALPDVMKALERCDCYPLGVPTNSDLLRRIKGE